MAVTDFLDVVCASVADFAAVRRVVQGRAPLAGMPYCALMAANCVDGREYPYRLNTVLFVAHGRDFLVHGLSAQTQELDADLDAWSSWICNGHWSHVSVDNKLNEAEGHCSDELRMKCTTSVWTRQTLCAWACFAAQCVACTVLYRLKGLPQRNAAVQKPPACKLC